MDIAFSVASGRGSSVFSVTSEAKKSQQEPSWGWKREERAFEPHQKWCQFFRSNFHSRQLGLIRMVEVLSAAVANTRLSCSFYNGLLSSHSCRYSTTWTPSSSACPLLHILILGTCHCIVRESPHAVISDMTSVCRIIYSLVTRGSRMYSWMFSAYFICLFFHICVTYLC